MARELAVNFVNNLRMEFCRLLQRAKTIFTKTIAIKADLNTPRVAALIKIDSFLPTLIIAASRFIHAILGASGLPKVYPFIVRLVAIDMIYFILWPFSIHPKPSYTMGKVSSAVDADCTIAHLGQTSGRFADAWSSVRSLHAPSESTVIRMIINQFAQAGNCNHGLVASVHWRQLQAGNN